jgi:flagellin
MGLRINTNVAAINASRVLRRSTADLDRSLKRLSSGLRITRAADAAGLAIAKRLNILSSVGTSVLAQANVVPRTALQLLR